MRAHWEITAAVALFVAADMAMAQPPGGPPGRPPGERRERGGGSLEDFLSRLFRFDANEDQKLTKEELVDPRLAALFERADVDKDGVVTKEELTAVYKQNAPRLDSRRGGPPGEGFGPGGSPDRGPGSREGRERRPPPPPHDADFRDGPPGRRGNFNFRAGPPKEGDEHGDRPEPRERGGEHGDRPGPRGRDGERGGPPPAPPRPGEILPHFLQAELNLSDEQRQSLSELQKTVDARLSEILTNDQKEQLKELPRRRPGGPGGPGGFRGPGGPGGPGGPRRPDGPPSGEEDRGPRRRPPRP